MKKKLLTAFAVGLFLLNTAGCGKKAEPETVQISVWSAEAQG